MSAILFFWWDKKIQISNSSQTWSYMPTQRRTLKTPPVKAARKLFKTVEQYFEWIRNSEVNIREKEHGAKRGVSKLIRQVVSRLLIKARAQDDTFRQCFEMPQGFPRRVAVQKLLLFNKPRDYTLRLPITQHSSTRVFQVRVNLWNFCKCEFKAKSASLLNQTGGIGKRNSHRKDVISS